jgi:hypothetical protein
MGAADDADTIRAGRSRRGRFWALRRCARSGISRSQKRKALSRRPWLRQNARPSWRLLRQRSRTRVHLRSGTVGPWIDKGRLMIRAIRHLRSINAAKAEGVTLKPGWVTPYAYSSPRS